MVICGMSAQTLIRSIDRKFTCGELKRQLGVSRLMSCGKILKDVHTFFDNDIIHVLGRLQGGMEVNLNQLPDEVTRFYHISLIFLELSSLRLCPRCLCSLVIGVLSYLSVFLFLCSLCVC